MSATSNMNGPRTRRGRKEAKKSSQIKDDNESSFSDLVRRRESTYKDHDRLLIKFSAGEKKWYQYSKDIPGTDETGSSSDEIASKYRAIADDIYRREIQLFGHGSGSKDDRWVEGTISKGTLKDRIAAMSVMVCNDPIHKFHSIDGLLQMAGGASEASGNRNSRVAQLAAEALEDLFRNTLLPPDRKLLGLNQRKLPVTDSSNSLSPRVLLLWRFEETLKDKFKAFISNYLGRNLREGLEMTKIAALRTAGALLRTVPEGEAEILAVMVNKLGDPGKKTAAAAGHELRQVLEEHPNMQHVMAREVQQLAHRPRLSSRALHNCVTFLNQLKLKHSDHQTSSSESLSAALINTYFKLFEVAVGCQRTSSSSVSDFSAAKGRLLSALLIGVNRAHPYLPKHDQKLNEHIDELYRLAHAAPPPAATQALLLLFHISVGLTQDENEGRPSLSLKQNDEATNQHDRFYRALFSALSSVSMLSQGKHITMFFNLLYKSMKHDYDSTRVSVFAKRILSTSMHCNPAVYAASVFLLNEVARHHEELQNYLAEVPDGDSFMVVLIPSKREPKTALASFHSDLDRQWEPYVHRATRSSSWELSMTAHHFHPSVAKFGQAVGNITYSGNPLGDFNLAPFLDKFAYKNPKKVKKGIHKRVQNVGERRNLRGGSLDPRQALPVNDPGFLKKQETAEQDDFYLKFFTQRAARRSERDFRSGEGGNTLDPEDAALDAAESCVFDHSFQSFQKNWDDDSDEEEFVDELAVKLLEASAGGEPVDVDEDPEFGDWNSSDSDDDAAESDEIFYDDEDNELVVDPSSSKRKISQSDGAELKSKRAR